MQLKSGVSCFDPCNSWTLELVRMWRPDSMISWWSVSHDSVYGLVCLSTMIGDVKEMCMWLTTDWVTKSLQFTVVSLLVIGKKMSPLSLQDDHGAYNIIQMIISFTANKIGDEWDYRLLKFPWLYFGISWYMFITVLRVIHTLFYVLHLSHVKDSSANLDY